MYTKAVIMPIINPIKIEEINTIIKSINAFMYDIF